MVCQVHMKHFWGDKNVMFVIHKLVGDVMVGAAMFT